MGYSKARITVERRWSMLKPLAEGKECRWRVDPGEEVQHAYKIREALYAAEHHPKAFPELSKARGRFEIQIERTGVVVARLKRAETEVEVVVGSPEPESLPEAPTQESNPTPQVSVDSTPITQNGKQHALSVAEAWRKAQPFKGKLYFPEADLEEDQLKKIYKWAEREDLLMFVSGKGLTLVPYDPELEEVAWEPEDDG